MGSFSWWHIALLLVVILIFFGGKGRVSDFMGDFAKGIKSFKKGLSDEPEETVKAEPKSLEKQDQQPTASSATSAHKIES